MVTKAGNKKRGRKAFNRQQKSRPAKNMKKRRRRRKEGAGRYLSGVTLQSPTAKQISGAECDGTPPLRPGISSNCEKHPSPQTNHYINKLDQAAKRK